MQPAVVTTLRYVRGSLPSSKTRIINDQKALVNCADSCDEPTIRLKQTELVIQGCIPVVCVPSAAVAVLVGEGGWSAGGCLPRGCLPRGVCPGGVSA